jgi:serine/threonine-protein kinase HipA
VSYEPVSVVEVRLWGRQLGAVALNPSSGWYSFAYAPEWVAGGVEVAPLHMPLRTAPYEFPGLNPETFHRLPALLADALPDAFGNALVNAWMADHGVDAAAITPLDRLAYAASRAMGALEFRPPADPDDDSGPTAVALADLVEVARSTISGALASDEASRAALQKLIQVGTSAGGARPKAVVSFNPATSQVHTSVGALPAGFEHWLIKLDGVTAMGLDGHGSDLGASTPYGRIEYAYSRMAAEAGLTMAPCQLLAEGPRRHFMTKRFDRGPGGTKHHVVSLCAMAHLDFNLLATHSYDQYLQTVTALGLDREALAEAYRRMVFNVVAVNRDDHTKNFSFLREQGGPWELSPAFDITHAYARHSRWTARHLMSVNGRFEAITIADLHAVGERHRVPGYRQIVREVGAAVAQWPSFAEAAEVPPDVTERILADLDAFRPT